MSDCKTLIDAAAERFVESDTPRLDAEVLLAHALGVSRAWMRAHADDESDAEAVARFEDLTTRRAAGVPVAHLTGRREFWSLDLVVTPDTLIPRPETELLVELALEIVPTDTAIRLLDLGTGSGAIALAIAHERPCVAVTAVDASEATLEVAQHNAARSGIENVRFVASDWFTALGDEHFDVIVSNPPYIAENDPHLQRGDVRFEPSRALVSGGDGLDAIRHIAPVAHEHLVPGGWLLVEHGPDQGEPVRAILAAAGFADATTHKDIGGRERITLGRAP